MIVSINDDNAEDAAVEALTGNGLAILPCDTVYGVCGCAPRTADKIREIKGRDENKPFIILVESVDEITRFTDQEIDGRLSGLWPAPLTLIVNRNVGGTVALRVPSSAFIRNVISRVGPIFSTSVNFSGEAPCERIQQIVKLFEMNVHLIVDAGDMVGAHPSTIVDTTVSPYRVVRNGSCHIPESWYK